MKPKQLKCPFRWDTRTPCLAEGVLYVPSYYFSHDQWSLQEVEQIYSSFSKISIEYCSGNGAWVAAKAKQEPDVLWIAVEKRFDRVQRIWAKKENEALSNLLIVCGEAQAFTKYYLKKSLIDCIYVNFPDPWPKDRHAKKRLVQASFLSEVKRVLKEEGEMVFVTDDELYQKQMVQELLQTECFSLFPSPFYQTEWEGYGTSYFEELWTKQGRTIYYMKFTQDTSRS